MTKHSKDPEKRKAANRRRGKRRTPIVKMLHSAAARARKAGLEFTIKAVDVFIPERCPLLGIELKRNVGGTTAHAASPTLDRIRSAYGYVPGNIIVISHRANTIKHNANAEEIAKLASNLKLLENRCCTPTTF